LDYNRGKKAPELPGGGTGFLFDSLKSRLATGLPDLPEV